MYPSAVHTGQFPLAPLHMGGFFGVATKATDAVAITFMSIVEIISRLRIVRLQAEPQPQPVNTVQVAVCDATDVPVGMPQPISQYL